MNITKLMLTCVAAIAFDTLTISPAVTQEINPDVLCQKFPLNSRCEDYPATKAKPQTYQLDRQIFCAKFPFNSRCVRSPLEVIKFNLDRSGEDDEWVRIEKRDNKIELIHTTRVKDCLVSGALNGALGALVPFPLPFVEANKYNWEDHQVIEVKFASDSSQSQFILTGKDTLVLPKGVDIYGGLFTITYREKDSIRSVSFKVPSDVTAQTDDTIIIETH